MPFEAMRLFAVLGSFGLASVTVITVARIAAKWHRGGSSEDLEAHEERIARLEHAVDALTVDSARLIDGQRFMSQLLTERPAAGQPAASADRA